VEVVKGIATASHQSDSEMRGEKEDGRRNNGAAKVSRKRADGRPLIRIMDLESWTTRMMTTTTDEGWVRVASKFIH